MTGTASVVVLAPCDVPDAAAFRRVVAEPCRPVVIRGLCRNWPATAAAATSAEALLHYLAPLDAGGSAEAFVGDPAIGGRYHYGEALAGFNFERQTMRFADALQRIVATAGEAGSVDLRRLAADRQLSARLCRREPPRSLAGNGAPEDLGRPCVGGRLPPR